MKPLSVRGLQLESVGQPESSTTTLRSTSLKQCSLMTNAAYKNQVNADTRREVGSIEFLAVFPRGGDDSSGTLDPLASQS
jgi:hypothetical protein